MYFAAEELVAPGGPSAPVWAFFSAISLALIGVMGQQIASKREAKAAREQATQAANSAEKAQANTVNVSNGFTNRMDSKLDAIIAEQNSQGNALREHFRWHLEQEEGKR